MFDVGLLRMLNREKERRHQRLKEARAWSAVWKRSAKAYRLLYLMLYADLMEVYEYEQSINDEARKYLVPRRSNHLNDLISIKVVSGNPDIEIVDAQKEKADTA